MKKLKTVCIILVLFLSVSLVFAGGGQQKDTSQSSGSTASSSGGLPIVSKTITLRGLSTDFGEITMSSKIKIIAELEKRTNVHLDIEVLPLQDTDDCAAKFHAIMASGDIPDLVDAQAVDNPTVINRYGMQGLFLPLNDLIKQYAPNMVKVFNNPLEGEILPYPINVWGDLTARDGKIYCLPFLGATNAIGPVWAIRTDWLKKLNLKVPQTPDELYTVLKAFKERDPNGNGKADEIPLASAQGSKVNTILPLINMFDAHMDLYVDQADKKIKYGPVEPAFRDGLAFLNKLYSEGLIESDYISATRDQWFSRSGGNQIGVQFVWPASGLGASNYELAKMDPSYRFEPMLPIKSPSGKQYKDTKTTGSVMQYRTSIGAKTKYKVEIMKYLDYLFSPEGQKLIDWGIEGETYNMVNGSPVFTDYVLKNPDGIDPETVQVQYGIRCDHLIPGLNRWAASMQALKDSAPDTIQAWKTYQQPGYVEAPMPILPLTEEESTRAAAIIADINTYKDPMIDKFIMGQESLSRFDEFSANVKKAGLDELLKLMNSAYDVYKANSK